MTSPDKHSSTTVTIRDERPDERDRISTVIEKAFADAPHTSGNEATIVSSLRKARALSLSLVAERDGSLIGHAAFSAVTVDGRELGWFGLGPVAVHPHSQRAGVGSALIRRGLLHLRARGAQGCVVLGEPDYYKRFGFISGRGLLYPGPPPAYFQSLTFGALTPRGIVTYHPAFAAC